MMSGAGRPSALSVAKGSSRIRSASSGETVGGGGMAASVPVGVVMLTRSFISVPGGRWISGSANGNIL